MFLIVFAHIMGGRGLLFFSGSDKEGTLAARVLKRPSNGGGGGRGRIKKARGTVPTHLLAFLCLRLIPEACLVIKKHVETRGSRSLSPKPHEIESKAMKGEETSCYIIKRSCLCNATSLDSSKCLV